MVYSNSMGDCRYNNNRINILFMSRLYRQINILERRKKEYISEGINTEDITMDLEWMYGRLGSHYKNKFHHQLLLHHYQGRPN